MCTRLWTGVVRMGCLRRLEDKYVVPFAVITKLWQLFQIRKQIMVSHKIRTSPSSWILKESAHYTWLDLNTDIDKFFVASFIKFSYPRYWFVKYQAKNHLFSVNVFIVPGKYRGIIFPSSTYIIFTSKLYYFFTIIFFLSIVEQKLN